MSGPKSGGYSVETAEARAARERAAAVASYEETRLAVQRLRVEAQAAREVLNSAVPVPDELPSVSARARSTDIAAADRSAQATLDVARARLREVCTELSRERWQARMGAAAIDDRRFASAADQVRAAEPVETWRTTCLDQLAELAAGWPPTVDRTALEEAAEIVGRCAGEAAATLAVARACDEFGRQRRSARAMEDRRALLARLRAAVSSVRQWHPESVTAGLLAEVAAAERQAAADFTELAERVDRHVADGYARRDRDEASAIVADVLVEMGYRVGEAFHTRLSSSDEVLVGRSDWTDHAVSVRLAADGTMFTHVVRAADASDGADGRVDAEFCSDFDVFSRRARHRGLAVSSVRRFLPGERAVRAVHADRVREVASARHEPTLRSRER